MRPLAAITIPVKVSTTREASRIYGGEAWSKVPERNEAGVQGRTGPVVGRRPVRQRHLQLFAGSRSLPSKSKRSEASPYQSPRRSHGVLVAFLAMVVGIMMILLPSVCPAEKPAVKLGALYNLTGGMSPIDSPGCRGSQLAAKLLNEKGGVLGGSKLDLIVIDTKTDLNAARKGADKLASIPVAAGLGYGDSDSVLAAAPVFEKSRIPFLTPGATDPELPERIGPFMFLTPFGDNDQAFAMADFAYKSLKARNVVLWINESTDFTRVLAKFFKIRYLVCGGHILDEQRFKSGKKDFSDLIGKLKKLSPQPDAIFVSGNPENAVPTVQSLRNSGIRIPILSGDGFDADLLKLLPDPEDANGVYFATHAFFQSKRPEVVAFVKAYTKAYGKAPESSFAALGFDAVNLLADAINRAGSTDGTAVARALAETRAFKGVTGIISFSRPSRLPIVPVGIVGVKNGKYELVTTWTP